MNKFSKKILKFDVEKFQILNKTSYMKKKNEQFLLIWVETLYMEIIFQRKKKRKKFMMNISFKKKIFQENFGFFCENN